MAIRGTLPQVIGRMVSRYGPDPDQLQAILYHPISRYYSMHSDSELADMPTDNKENPARLLFRGTLRELGKFMSFGNRDLFAKETPDARTPDNSDRQ